MLHLNLCQAMIGIAPPPSWGLPPTQPKLPVQATASFLFSPHLHATAFTTIVYSPKAVHSCCETGEFRDQMCSILQGLFVFSTKHFTDIFTCKTRSRTHLLWITKRLTNTYFWSYRKISGHQSRCRCSEKRGLVAFKSSSEWIWG